MNNLVKRLNKKIPAQWREKPSSARLGAALLGAASLFDADFRKALIRAADRYREMERAGRGKIRREMLLEYVRGWITPDEYYKFRLLNQSNAERRQFISEYEGLALFRDREHNILPHDKYERYKMFSSFFRREIVNVPVQAGPREEESYRFFIARNDAFIAKRVVGTKGHGIRRCVAAEAPDTAALIDLMGGACIAEPLIQQGQTLAVFHPASVNTVRFVTGMNESGALVPLFALLRVGRGGSIVDNVGSGGLIALIDMDSGIVTTDALCGLDDYVEHPDTHVQFKGTQVPEWAALCRVARDMHASQPGQRLFGFDFAWTTTGWDVVEVNPQPSFVSWQALTHRGIRPILADKGILRSS